MTSQIDQGGEYYAERTLRAPAPPALRWLRAASPYIRVLRPQQWIKNAFVAAPLFFAPQLLSWGAVGEILLGMAAFSLISSAVYILNDTVDRDADRMHPKKCRRPIASGEISTASALCLFVVVLALGLATAFTLDGTFGTFGAVYFVVNVAYCFRLKHISLVDVLTITTGFVLRVMAGASLLEAEVSVWVILCTGLVALFIAFAKRRDDLTKSLDGTHRPSLNGYTKPFLDAVMSVVLGALLVAYMMYVTDDEVLRMLGTEELYLTVPFVLAGILRYLQISLVEERSGAPSTIVVTDVFLVGCILSWAAVFVGLAYL